MLNYFFRNNRFWERQMKRIISFMIDNDDQLKMRRKENTRREWNANDSRWFEILMGKKKKMRR